METIKRFNLSYTIFIKGITKKGKEITYQGEFNFQHNALNKEELIAKFKKREKDLLKFYLSDEFDGFLSSFDFCTENKKEHLYMDFLGCSHKIKIIKCNIATSDIKIFMDFAKEDILTCQRFLSAEEYVQLMNTLNK